MSQSRMPEERQEGGPPESAARVLYARRLMPAGRVLVVILVTLLTWTVLYAPTLKRAAEASPLGARRTVSLALLRPISAVSDWIGLNELAGSIERAVGRDQGRPGGAFVPPPEDIPLTPEEEEDPPGNGNGGTAMARRPRPIPSGRPRPSENSASRSSETRSRPVSGTSPNASSCPGSSGYRVRAGSPRASRGPTTSTGRTRCTGSSTGSTPTS